MLLLDYLNKLSCIEFSLFKKFKTCVSFSHFHSYFTERCSHSCISRSASVSCCNFEGIINILHKIFFPNTPSHPSSSSWAPTSWGTRISSKLSYILIDNLMLICYYWVNVSFPWPVIYQDWLFCCLWSLLFITFTVSLQIDALWLTSNLGYWIACFLFIEGKQCKESTL